jgi:hypothetical protein
VTHRTDRESEAATAALERDESIAHGLVGAQIGAHIVTGREKPGHRWLYLLLDTSTGKVRRLRGFEVIRLARQARESGLNVTGLTIPWRDEERAPDD